MPRRKSAPAATEVVVELPPIMDVRAAGPLHGVLRGHRGRSVVLDGGAVERLGGQCLQVLLAASAAWRQDGAGFRLAPVSASLSEGLALLGCSADMLSGIGLSGAGPSGNTLSGDGWR